MTQAMMIATDKIAYGCPYCGYAPKLSKSYDAQVTGHFTHLRCTNSGCPVKPHVCGGEEEVFRIWNTRVAIPARFVVEYEE